MIATCKLGEKGCWNDGKCRATSNCTEKVVTNADKIRAMTDEELAEVIMCPKEFYERMDCMENSSGKCEECCLEWLKRPAEVSE